MTKRLKLAFVVQRYGLDVNGGAEFHCRLLAEHMSNYHDVEVITTCAKDYITWKNEYNEEKEIVNNIIVWRFPVDFSRNIHEFGKLSDNIFKNYHSIEDEIKWIRLQGPYSIKLLNFIKEKREEFDYFIFFTYLYFPTVYGLHLIKDKAILVPTAHDEPPIYLSIFESVFKMPKAIAYNTEEEKKFINSKFKNDDTISDIIGVGIQKIENINGNDFNKKYNIDKFIIYVGRIDESKGCKELIEYFIRFKEDLKSNIKLVLVGKPIMKIPKHPDIITPGFVSEQDKYNAIGASELLISPSKYESLSMVIMEAWACNKAVLVNGNCEVLKGQCIKSNGGLYYENYDEFRECLNILLNDQKLRDKMGENGRKYVDNNYDWDIIEKKYLNLIDNIKRQNITKFEESGSNNIRKLEIIDKINQHVSKNSFRNCSICELVNVSKWYDDEWFKLQEYLKLPKYYPPDFVHRKTWEYIQCIYGLEKLGMLNDKSICLGVGTGHEPLIYYFSNRVKRVIATDIYDEKSIWKKNEGDSEILIDIDKFAPFPYKKERIEIKRMDGRKLEFPENNFDFIWSLSSIEHFGGHEGAAKSLKEMERVLKPGGILALATEYVIDQNILQGFKSEHPDFFNLEDLYKHLIASHNLKLIQPIDFSMDEYYIRNYVKIPEEAISPTVKCMKPHIVLRLNDVLVTSVFMFFRKEVNNC